MSKKFDKLLEAATDSTNLEPNWDAIIACFDSVRAGEVPAKIALTGIHKRLHHENPHVVHHTLLVLDACVKNCGPKFHCEVATRDFMEDFKDLADNKFEKVRTKALEMLQCWAMAFANKTEYKIIVDTHNLLKLSGFDFPSIKEADAMFMAQVAPDWADGAECYRCRSEFGLLTRRHHCRACGQIFCDRCSSHEMPLPQFGIDKEVRVCDACFEKGMQRHNEKLIQARQNAQDKKIKEMLGGEVTEAEKDRLLREKEEEDLAKALQLSKIEAESKEKQHKNYYSLYNGDSSFYPADQASYTSNQDIGYKGTAPTVPESPSELSLAADDPLARYMNRDYWQQRKAENKVEEWTAMNTASAPAPSDIASVATMSVAAEEPHFATLMPEPTADAAIEAAVEAQAEDTTKWCSQLKEQVGVMENRIRSNIARGRAVVNDTAIQGLFLKLTEYHANVLQKMQKLDEERTYYEGLQDHLGHIVDARSAVNQLREDHNRRKKEQIEAEQRARQAQMKQTLDLMRMKKHAMLLEQRDVALQRFQQQEQEMQARRQQQPIYATPGYIPQQVPQHPYGKQGQQPVYSVPYYHSQQYVQQQPNVAPQPLPNQYAAPVPGIPPAISSYQGVQASTAATYAAPLPTNQQQPSYTSAGYSLPHDQSPQPMMYQQPDQSGYGYHPQQQQHQMPMTPQPPSVHHVPQQAPNNAYSYHTAQQPQSVPAPAPMPEPAPVQEANLISFD